MRRTDIKCSDCGEYLIDCCGSGDEQSFLICDNVSCPSHFKNIPCPQCGSDEKRIQVRGIGDFVFKCKSCEKVWKTVDDN